MIKDLGKLKYLLGYEVVDTEKSVCLNKRKYCLDLSSKFAATTLQSKLIITNEPTNGDPLLENITDYQKLIGKSIYLTNIGHDISYVIV